MAVEMFRNVNFRQDSLTRIDECNAIIQQYTALGLTLTLRQLYYQLVTKNVIPNVEKSYRNLGGLVSDARLAGLMDWDAIEDRVRQPHTQSEFRDIAHLVDVAVRAYRLPRWRDQECYVELWVEKEALAGVLSPLASEFHVTMMVNKGYSSQSAMYESAQRFKSAVERSFNPILFYLGDHDPSGEDMVRDIRDRLAMFGVEVDVQKLGLTIEQVRKYKLPPNPAKLTDSRAAAYVKKYGNHSWEVDALPPDVLTKIIRTAFLAVVDLKKMDAIKRREQVDKTSLREVARKLVVAPQDDEPEDEDDE